MNTNAVFAGPSRPTAASTGSPTTRRRGPGAVNVHQEPFACVVSGRHGHYTPQIWITPSPDADTVRITATDLAQAQRTTERLRADVASANRDPGSLTVLLDLEIHIAPTARLAREQAASRSVDPPTSVRYIGTASGLAGLISDIHAVGVADGVALIPIVPTPIAEIVADYGRGCAENAERREHATDCRSQRIVASADGQERPM